MATVAGKKFWMVKGVGILVADRAYYHHPSAVGEAERLARTHLGVKFFVLEAVYGYVTGIEAEVDQDSIVVSII